MYAFINYCCILDEVLSQGKNSSSQSWHKKKATNNTQPKEKKGGIENCNETFACGG